MTGQENCLTKLVKKQKSFSEGAIPNAILLAAVTQKFGSMALAPKSDIIKSTNPYTWAINGTIATFATNKALGLASGVAMDRLGKKEQSQQALGLPMGDVEDNQNKSSLRTGLEKFSKIAGSKEMAGLLYSSISQTFLLSTVAPESEPSLEAEHSYKRYLNGSISVFAAVIATGLMASMALNQLNKMKDKGKSEEGSDLEELEEGKKGEEQKNDKGVLHKIKSGALSKPVDCVINSAAAARFAAVGFAPKAYHASTPSAYMRAFNGIIAFSAALMSAGLVATSIINKQSNDVVEEQSQNDELGSTIGSTTHAKKVELTRGKRDKIISANEVSALSLGL